MGWMTGRRRFGTPFDKPGRISPGLSFSRRFQVGYNRRMPYRGPIKLILLLIPIMTGLTACTREVDKRDWTPPASLEQTATLVSPVTSTPEAVPPPPFQLPPTRDPSSPILLPTPDL